MSFAVPGGEPVASKRCSRFEVSDHDKSQLMSIIHGYYKVALGRLPLSLIPRVHKAGLCVGFLDPVSNILANTILSGPLPDEKEVNQEQRRRAKKWSSLDEREVNQEDRRRRGKKRMRSQPGGASNEGMEEELEKGVEEESEKWIEEESEENGIVEESEKGIEEEIDQDVLLREREMYTISTDAKSIAARSLEGLINFLTSCFRYLYAWEALFYLVQSRGDLLAAVCLIERGRGTHTFVPGHPTAEVALTCAALAAMHPQPDTFVSSTLTLASCYGIVHSILQVPSWRPWLSTSSMYSLAKVCEEAQEGVRHAPSLEELIIFRRFNSLEIARHPVGIDHKLSMKRVLLDKIHVFYLEAISRFPTALLRSRLHRALLKAGYCYGPFDPVANILLNTIWYDTAFPSQLELEVDMIRMESLALIESRSLNGLVAFMSALFPTISTVDALIILLQKNANLGAAVNELRNGGLNPSIPDSQAYQIAASKIHHPNPSLLADLAAGSMPAVEAALKHLAKSVLSPGDVQVISKSLLDNHPHAVFVGPKLVPQLTPQASQIVSASCKEFENRQELIRKMVEAALREHERRQGDDYGLHAICGVNTNISKDGKFGYFLNRYGYPFAHINVWARRRSEHHADAACTLLFIECSNDCEGMKDATFLCTPVSGLPRDSGRCFHCERAGIKIVHPSLGSYHGQSCDFKLMAFGKHSVTNETLVSAGERMTLFVGAVVIQDLVYSDPAWDADSAKIINFMARREEEERNEDPSATWERLTKLTENLHQEFFGPKEGASVSALEPVV